VIAGRHTQKPRVYIQLIPFQRLHKLILPPIRELAKLRLRKIRAIGSNPGVYQKKMLRSLLGRAGSTAFGRKHGFDKIQNHADFIRQVPIMNYENLYPYIQRILDGESDVLWPGRPVALASTSGTNTGPIKYIPVTSLSAPAYRVASRDSVLAYVAETGNSRILAGKMLFMSQNPEYQRIRGLPVAPISGVSMARVPRFFRRNLLPSPEVACIEDWEEKLDAMLAEALGQNMTLISGIPPWLQLFFDHVIQRTGKKIGEVFPNLLAIVHGGVNFEPYKAAIQEAVGRKVDLIETYAATEGFIAFQDDVSTPGMLPSLLGGMFFEFVPADEINAPNPTRLRLDEVEIGTNYCIVLTGNAGLWAYDIGDTVKFISKNPCRLVVTGRSKHFISAFGEHVIVEQVDTALAETATLMNLEIREYTVAPCIHPEKGLPHHEWFIEFEKPPEDSARFALQLDDRLRLKNIIYNGLVDKNILCPLQINQVRRHGFRDYMAAIGKLGGQNKVPHILNERRIAHALQQYLLS